MQLEKQIVQEWTKLNLWKTVLSDIVGLLLLYTNTHFSVASL